MPKKLGKEFKYFLDHQDELVEKYNGKIVVIKGTKVIGAFGSVKEAYNTTVQKHELGTFLIQKCEPGTESYTQTFYSRVFFA